MKKVSLGPVAKTAVAAVVGAAAVLNVVASDGSLDTNDVIQIGLAVATAIGVYAVPNTPAE